MTPALIARRDPKQMVGREREVSHLQDLIQTEPDSRRGVHIAGDRGLGRSTMLGHAVRLAHRANPRALLLRTSAERRGTAPLAPLHCLYRLSTHATVRLSHPDRQILDAAFASESSCSGVACADVARVLRQVLIQLSDTQPLVLAVDDLPDLDELSLEVISTLGIGAPDGNIILLTTGTSGTSERPVIELGPLTETDSVLLAADQPVPPTGVALRRIVAQSAGNPLAIVELSELTARRPDSVRTVQVALPPTPRLVDAFASRLNAMPAGTTTALRLIAAGSTDLHVLHALVRSTSELRPAIDAGLITTNSVTASFTHPMVAAIVYYTDAPGRRRRTHRLLAEALAKTDPCASAWQSALAGDSLNERGAMELSGHAEYLTGRSDYASAAKYFAAAAVLSPDPMNHEHRARQAIRAASAAGGIGWEEQLAKELLVPAISAPADDEDVESLLTIAKEAYLSGSDAARQKARSVAQPRPTGDERTDARVARYLASVTADPDLHRRAAAALVAPEHNGSAGPGGSVLDRPTGRWAGLMGIVALALDETQHAIRLFEVAADTTRDRTSRFDAACLGALQWAYYDAGRLDDARRQSAWIRSSAAGNASSFANDSALLVADALADLSSDTSNHTDTLGSASRVPTSAHPYVQARWRHARALIAAGRGDHDEAWRQLRLLFEPDGEPRHYAISTHALGDLASAARRVGRADEAAKLTSELASRTRAERSVRSTLVLHRALALSAEPDRAEHHFRLALVHPAGELWRLERAFARMDYAEWLRRRHRPTEARDLFTAAYSTFDDCGLTSWAQRARAELLAAGGTLADHADATVQTTLAHGIRLTPQQRLVAQLAADGLTNKQIALQLSISVRTVASHLAQAFDALGVRRRVQLAAALSRAF